MMIYLFLQWENKIICCWKFAFFGREWWEGGMRERDLLWVRFWVPVSKQNVRPKEVVFLNMPDIFFGRRYSKPPPPPKKFESKPSKPSVRRIFPIKCTPTFYSRNVFYKSWDVFQASFKSTRTKHLLQRFFWSFPLVSKTVATFMCPIRRVSSHPLHYVPYSGTSYRAKQSQECVQTLQSSIAEAKAPRGSRDGSTRNQRNKQINEMKTEMKKKFFFCDCRVWCREWVWKKNCMKNGSKVTQIWKYGRLKISGFELEGKGKQSYAGFEPRNVSLFLTEPTLKNW